MARPIPRDPPVIRATLSFRTICFSALTLCPGDRAFGGRSHQGGVFSEDSGREARRRRGPAFHALVHFALIQFYVQTAVWDIEDDEIAFAKAGDGSAARRFRSYMTGHQSARCAAKTPVGDQSH